MHNVSSYAAKIYAASPVELAYKDAKYAYERSLVDDVTQDIRDMLREERDIAEAACEDVYNAALREAYEHYD